MRNTFTCGPCAICDRVIPEPLLAEEHHLVPKCFKGKETVTVCMPCGDQIHNLFTPKELRDAYNTVRALKEEPRMQKWIRWIRKTNHWSVRSVRGWK